ncbi:hypothetical protein U0355_10320 [Salimicrobium sp. PL1-032A]|uniref:hypothetical protein n=1 Tax=Salimicrobium sp. PL1-032A TaxID=3095364 RepID=UPI0032603BAD
MTGEKKHLYIYITAWYTGVLLLMMGGLYFLETDNTAGFVLTLVSLLCGSAIWRYIEQVYLPKRKGIRILKVIFMVLFVTLSVAGFYILSG